jgi:hypothetical protein
MKTRIDTMMEAEERRAEKVQELIALMRDPDVADFVAKLFGEPISATPAQPVSPNGQGLKLPDSLTLTPAIRFIASGITGRFKVSDLAKKLQGGGFDFGERKPETAVRDAVYLLCRGENPIFRVVEEGKGGQPNIYERI